MHGIRGTHFNTIIKVSNFLHCPIVQQLTSSFLDKAFLMPADISRYVPKVINSCTLLYGGLYVKLLQPITYYRAVHSTYVSLRSGYCTLGIFAVSGLRPMFMPMFMPMFKGSEIDGYNNTRPTIRSTILYTRDCLSRICFHFEPQKGYLLKNQQSQSSSTHELLHIFTNSQQL